MKRGGQTLTGRECVRRSNDRRATSRALTDEILESKRNPEEASDDMAILLSLKRSIANNPQETADAVYKKFIENSDQVRIVAAGIPGIEGETFREKCRSMYDGWKNLSEDDKARIHSKRRNQKIQRERFVVTVDASGLSVEDFIVTDEYKHVSNMTQLWQICTAKRYTNNT